MSNYFGRQPSSRPIAYQATALATSSTVATKLSAETYQIRLAATQSVWVTVGDSSSVAASTTGGSMLINGGVAGEYVAVTPGQFVAWLSTSATTGWFSLTEMS